MNRTNKVVLDKMIATINSCISIEQLHNTYIWCFTIINNRYVHKLKGACITKKYELYGESNGFVMMILSLINKRAEQLGLKYEVKID